MVFKLIKDLTPGGKDELLVKDGSKKEDTNANELRKIKQDAERI